MRAYSILIIPTLLASTTACTDDDSKSEVKFVAPTTPADVAKLYDSLGTCNDSSLTRQLEPRTKINVTSIWMAPDDAPAGIVRTRNAEGKWSTAMAPNELGFSGISSDIQATSDDDPCLAVERLFSPHTPQGTNRSEFLHALFYLDEGTHPYTAYPTKTDVEPKRADAPLAVKSYLNAVSAVREEFNGGYLFSDAVSQELPMYVSCDKPFQIETQTVTVGQNEIAKYDRALCDGGSAGSDGWISYQCIAERAVNVAGNTCKFVVDGSSLVTDAKAHPVVFGGTITTSGAESALTYKIHIDRFSKPIR